MEDSYAYTYDDVTLIPQYGNVNSRLDADTTTWLTRYSTVKCPLIPANMDTVIGPELAAVIVQHGGYPIFHRFCSLEQQLQWVHQFPNQCYVSCGLETPIENIRALLEAGARGVCIDVAHGHTQRMLDRIKEIKQLRLTNPPNENGDVYPKEVIAGNVCTPEAVHDLFIAGADAVKVGIGAGACCSTRMVTGQGIPQFSAVLECAKRGLELRIPIIADGGIRQTRDFCLAIAAGAMTVMAGGLFAQCQESATHVSGQGVYRGQSSAEFMRDYYGQVKSGIVPEGIQSKVTPKYTAESLLNEYMGALRSSMTYSGSNRIKEFHEKAKFRKVTSTYMAESRPRPMD